MRTRVLALTATLAAAAAVAAPTAQAKAPDWRSYPRPVESGHSLATRAVAFGNDFTERITGTPVQWQARDAIATELKALGYSVTVEKYLGALEAVTATKRGTTKPGELLVLGAHFDTLPQSIKGTYDNGSGTNLVLGLARAYAKVRTQRTLVFSFYNGEEEGTLASSQQATAYRDAGKHVRAYLGFDMVGIAWPVGGTTTDKNCLCMWRGARDAALDQVLATVNYGFLKFPKGKRTVSIEGKNVRNSDEDSWATQGFRTLRWAGLRAAADYPEYHMPNDNETTIDSVAGGRTYFEAGLRNTLLSAYYTAAYLDTER